MPYADDSPSPVPWPTGLVVKKGSKARARVSGLMPSPVSETVARTYRPSATPWRSASADERVIEVAFTERLPPPGMA